MKPKQLITPDSLTKPGRNLNNMCDMDVEECIMNPIPIVEIKDEDDYVPQISMCIGNNYLLYLKVMYL